MALYAMRPALQAMEMSDSRRSPDRDLLDARRPLALTRYRCVVPGAAGA